VPELAALFAADDLEIGDRGVEHGIPVHEAFAAVDEAFVIQPHEHFENRARQPRVHRETVA
jgi:hypothetical protein